ncbi:MAG: hypothetical protein H7281_02620, partial [Bacteriovorax sp.]|nr:hypothetical protein [Bacteriovorax sp.]
MIQLKAKEKLFKKLFLYWLSVFFVVLFEGAVTDGKLGLSLIFLINFIPIAIMSNFLLSMYDYKFKTRFYIIAIPIAVILTFVLNYLGAPFIFTSMPIVLINTGPLFEGLFVSLVVHKKEDRQIEKVIACFLYGSGILSCFYYASARFHASELQFIIGFGSAFISYLLCSMLLPVLCIQIINQKRTIYLEALVKDRTRELSESKNKKEKLLRVLVHDISNPLQAVMFQIGQIKKTIPQENELFNKAQKNLKAIKDIISHVREYECVLSGTRTLELGDVSLHECLVEIEEIFTDRFMLKDINLKIHNKLSHDTKIRVDRTSFIHSVASNLVSNALKFSRPGTDVLIVAHERDSHIVIEVVDQGIGMSKQNLNNLFDIGISTSRAGTLGEVGTGFGMPIVKAYTHMFGGRVEASSSQKEEDSGTTISLYLPNIEVYNK